MKRIQIFGATPSPYTQKMVALMRYRHIPYTITWGDPGSALDALGIEKPRPTLMPVCLFDEHGKVEAVCDSTPIIRRLERLYPDRSVLPQNPALAFIDYLIEDFADEWCTKYMFHYRWYPACDADNAGTLIPLSMDISMPPELLAQRKSAFSQRQIGRLHVVGSSEATAPAIDASYRRFLTAMENLLADRPFALGHRPGAGDFALYGQLTQLVGFDPTPREIAHQLSPRTVAWVDRVADLSGVEVSDDDWAPVESAQDSLGELLAEVGRVYVPALLANAAALKAGEKAWSADIDGVEWSQQTFPYQAKCLRWIIEQYGALAGRDRAAVDALLQGTGCEVLFSQA